ncbi:hypothetical protein [Columbia Basin potato purple top phytoplasma]|uniref:Integral membrane protein n=1 Tax=Columbia Basin potato purple top phytoplasma TaxID=307134 RepID=A0ABT5L9G7_9MOLU|nr:hypothetical protein [Columbia Basin potato purple top phytoplasma]MDC9032157.1 hypothetical protein [Columbia Basin potato purple top phytoplasma]
MKKNINIIQLKKLNFSSLFISISLVLFQINSIYLKSQIKMPFVYSNYWIFWHLPLFFIGLFFSLRDTLFFLFIYMFIDVSLYSCPKYIIELTALNYGDNITLKVFRLLSLIILGTCIPILTHIFVSVFINCRKNNYKKIFFCFCLIVFLQSISRTFNGYFNYLPYLIENFKESDFISKFIQNSSFNILICLWGLNLIPIFISNFLNFIVFFIIKPRIIKIYELYFPNYSFK